MSGKSIAGALLAGVAILAAGVGAWIPERSESHVSLSLSRSRDLMVPWNFPVPVIEAPGLPGEVRTPAKHESGPAPATEKTEAVRHAVGLVEEFSDEYAEITDTSRRKQRFIEITVPLVRQANREIQELRGRIEAALRADERPAWLEETARRFGIDDLKDGRALLRRIDVVPVSLAVAQAAVESGWGTSRFARAGNALFGQRTWRAEDAGLAPERAEGFRVRQFETLLAGVRAYMHNINSHPAYGSFRRTRETARHEGKPLDSRRLAESLKAYSEKGSGYVRLLKAVMEDNDLLNFDGPEIRRRISRTAENEYHRG